MSSNRGSALLIVLGMLTFMVVSAVSFSIFMRQSRAPSSYLRRSASSRYLLKAALANAISRLDGQRSSLTNNLYEGVRDDPYPGVSGETSISRNGNYWAGHVFCPFGPVGAITSSGSSGSSSGTAPARYRTVSTLTLEGLAYLPPALINEVRLYSRLTRTAEWRNLTYDAGRYAFTAVDVSDCFDINKLNARKRRSAAANERISLSSLYPLNGNELDGILQEWKGGNGIPFTSVADFNIVAGDNCPFAPFASFVGSRAGKQASEIIEETSLESVSNALFITDTWFPPTNSVGGVTRYNLEADGQPFDAWGKRTVDEVVAAKTVFGGVLARNLCGIGLAGLYDYLDEDSLPISLCVPTTETVPMVTALGLNFRSTFRPLLQGPGPADRVEGAEQSAPYLNGANPVGTSKSGAQLLYKWVAKKYTLSRLFDQLQLTGSVAYPFKRANTKGYNGTFRAEALIRIYFAPPDSRCRIDSRSPLAIADRGAWGSASDSDGTITIPVPIGDTLSFGSDVMTQREALKAFAATVNPPMLNRPIFWYVTQAWRDPNPTAMGMSEGECQGGEYISIDGINQTGSPAVPFYDNEGMSTQWKTRADAALAAGGNAVPQPASTVLTGNFVPHVAVWVRILDDAGKTVDLVPARIRDDEIVGNGRWDARGMDSMFNGTVRNGANAPLLNFSCRDGNNQAFSFADLGARLQAGNGDPLGAFPQPFELAWSELYAPDPRFNHAPENWFATEGSGGEGDISQDKWLDRIGGLLGQDGRDPDIFMFTSDQEMLQSIGELAFLPALGTMDGSDDETYAGEFMDHSARKMDGSSFSSRLVNGAPTSNWLDERLAAGRYMWRTYTPVAHHRSGRADPIYALRDGGRPVEVVAGENDFRVNPFSRDTRVLAAAFRDTPFDYYVASSNETLNSTAGMEPSERASFAFCRESSVARLDDGDLAELAASFREGMAERAREGGHARYDWAAEFGSEAFGWYEDNEVGDNQRTLWGVELADTLHAVDRKFLYSYWRECFQNRQQLFLIFLRAEPLTVGGMGEDSLASAQLGARGVALVWRDPLPPPSAGGAFCTPHRTRVLFYHQFD